MEPLSIFDSRANDAQRCSVPRSGERTCVAVREDGARIRQQFLAKAADALITFDIFGLNCESFTDQSICNDPLIARVARNFLEQAVHAFNRPKEVHSCRASSGESFCDLIEIFAQFGHVSGFLFVYVKSDAHCCCYSDGSVTSDALSGE